MLITVKELCTQMKVTRTTIDNWRKQGMPYEKFGKLVRFNDTDVMKWIKSRNIELSPEIDLEDLIFRQIRDSIFEEYEEIKNKPFEETAMALIKTHNKLIKWFMDVTIGSKQDFLNYMKKWNLKIDDSNKLNRMLTSLNDEDFDGIMLGGLIRQIQELRAEEIARICQHFQILTMERRFKHFDIFDKEGAMDLADEFTTALVIQEKFLEKVAELTIKNSKNVLDELPSDAEIQELYDICKG